MQCRDSPAGGNGDAGKPVRMTREASRRAQVHNPPMELPQDLAQFNQFGADCLPGHLGIVMRQVADGEVHAELTVWPKLMAPNGYLHAGSVVTLADTSAGYGCIASLPKGASGFTTLELKSNHLGTAREGTLDCVAKIAHRGRTTQVWDATVTHRESGKTVALFRCTQMILYPTATA
jgi:1,4-dihydroxy-2-naphthoyl-CoA hydrolase